MLIPTASAVGFSIVKYITKAPYHTPLPYPPTKAPYPTKEKRREDKRR